MMKASAALAGIGILAIAIVVAVIAITAASGRGEAASVFDDVTAEQMAIQHVVIVDPDPEPKLDFPPDLPDGMIRAGGVLEAKQLVRVDLTFGTSGFQGGWTPPTGEHLAWAMLFDVSRMSGLVKGDYYGPPAPVLHAGADITIVFIDAATGQLLAYYQHFPEGFRAG